MVNKKAISPLIATLLLIAFTVALGVMIMNFGKNIVDDYGECKSIEIKIDSSPNSICFLKESSELSFTIINHGKTDVSSLVVRSTDLNAYGDNRIKEFIIPTSKIASGGYLSQKYPYSRPESLKIEFIPRILKKNSEEKCLAQAITITSLNDCS